MRVLNKMLLEIEKGLLEFLNLELKESLNFIIRENYAEEKAYWWQFPSGNVITCSNKTYQMIIANNNPRSMFKEIYDSVTVLHKSNFHPVQTSGLTHRRLSTFDKRIVDEFHSLCPDEDKKHGQVSIEDRLVVGTFKGNILVGIASIWELPNQLADIGILVRPDYKKQGVGVSTVSYLVTEIIDHYIPIYRADDWNRASVLIYKKLGFEEIVKIYPMKGNPNATKH